MCVTVKTTNETADTFDTTRNTIVTTRGTQALLTVNEVEV